MTKNLLLREQAWNSVAKIRSWDAPGFDVCVDAEYVLLKKELDLNT